MATSTMLEDQKTHLHVDFSAILMWFEIHDRWINPEISPATTHWPNDWP